MTVSDARARIASLAHGLAHEVAALQEARRRLGRFAAPLDNTVLDEMIAERRARVALLADEVIGHA